MDTNSTPGENINPNEVNNLPEESTNSATENTTQQPLLKTNDMEVHSHSHTPRLKWSHYFWEFLMLFLAVFCGFLAEYKLEHIFEHQRENQYAKILLFDLRADSLYFADRIKLVESRLKKHQQFYELMTGSVKAADKQILNAFLPL